ncbi:MAG: SufD family Fe-S cluster assembly protein [archaeon]|nr:SufD family Fe-S cluster assembly protein [archaeon]
MIDCLFDDDLSGNNELEFSIDEGTQLDLNMVDLSIGDMDMHLSVHLGRGSSCNIRLASVCQPGMKKVFAFDTIHDEGNTLSRTKMAGINLGDGTLRFIGTSDVVNGAHGSDTRQEGRITNLSEGSRSEVSPALLIKDNEVNASHGAAVGAYDPEAMYYLMSRGLTEAESRRLITVGSLIPIIDSLSDKSLAAEVYNSLEALKI